MYIKEWKKEFKIRPTLNVYNVYTMKTSAPFLLLCCFTLNMYLQLFA